VVVHRVVRDWSPSRRGLGDLRHVDRILKEADVRVLHVLFPDSVNQGSYQLPALLGIGRIPLVATWWNLGLGRHSPMAVRAQSLALLLRARVLTSHDPSYLGVLRRTALRRPVEWLPVGNNLSAATPVPDRAEARRSLELDEGPLWLGFFGQLDPTRGVEDLFASLQAVRREHDVRLVMIGSAGRPERYHADPQSAAYLQHVRSLPSALGVEDAVQWTGYLSDDDVIRAFRAIDICVLPYRRNSIGRSALATALETGTPTVLAGTPAGIAPLRPEEHVALVPRRDPTALGATLTRLVEDRGERERLHLGALAGAEFFSWDHVADRAASIYARFGR
jgi:glycosyltransferase involved in cell wall biosynthesis